MAFCSKCGNQLEDSVQFCKKCGTPVADNINNGEKRVQTFVGEIRKCAHCGSVLEGFTAVCPSCGFEVTSKRVSEAITDFTNRLHEIGEACAKDINNTKVFWTSWSIFKKIGFVILNLIAGFIPLIICILWSLLRIFTVKNLSVDEKIKKELIENFVVPNNKEDIMEFLLFAKAQRDKEYSMFDMKARFWIGIWNNKCEQIIEKASALFANDKSFILFLNEQKLLSRNIKQKRRRNTLVMVVMLTIMIAGIIGLLSFFVMKEEKTLNSIPQEKTVPASSISITGDFADYYRIVGDAKLFFDKRKFAVTMVTELDAIQDIQPEIDTQIDSFLQLQKWQRSDCSIDLYEGIHRNMLTVNGYSVQDQKNTVEAFLKLKKREPKKFSILLVTNNKNYAIDLMSKDVFHIDTQLEYQISNREQAGYKYLEIK